MQKRIAQIFGVLVAGLAIAGLFVNDDHLFGLMNVDGMLDLLRIILAALLLYVGFGKSDAGTRRGALVFLGVLYVGLGIAGLIDSEVFGLLPTGLTGFDLVFHLASGALALYAGMMKNPEMTDPNAV